jgi:hypothetical protein
MNTKVVDYDSLAVLLLLEKQLEPTPEVFRSQPNVTLVVPFEEYISFIELLLGSLDLLATPSETLHHHLREYRLGDRGGARKKLFSAFLRDMSFAVAKEVYYSEQRGKGCTRIIHRLEEGVTLSAQDIDSYYANVALSTAPAMLTKLSCKGYAMPAQISAPNAYAWKYAVVLNFLSNSIPFYWSYQ